MREVVLASVFGFCKGVENSVALAEQLINTTKDKKLYSAGDIIHNKGVVEDLKNRGLVPITSPEGYEKGIILTCAHGITPEKRKSFEDAGFEVVEGTCRIVQRNHKIISDSTKPTIFIGKKDHPETISTMAYSKQPCTLISTVDDLDLLSSNITYNAVVQTTYSSNLVEEIRKAIDERNLHVNILTDICNSSKRRRDAVKKICESCDTIVIIGDKHSANSQGLKKIAENEGVKAFLISDEKDITPEILASKRIGLSAGASVPMTVIKRVRRCLIDGEAT